MKMMVELFSKYWYLERIQFLLLWAGSQVFIATFLHLCIAQTGDLLRTFLAPSGQVGKQSPSESPAIDAAYCTRAIQARFHMGKSHIYRYRGRA